MQKNIGKEFQNLAQREAFLKDNCDKVEEKGYMKPFTSEELQLHKENLADISIKIDAVEQEKKSSASYFKKELDPLLENRGKILSNIRQKAEYVFEICYKFVDHDEKMTGYYNSAGDLIECRPLTADELQPTFFSVQRKQTEDEPVEKTGTND